MQDPSFGIPKELIQHVHLVSTHRFPFTPRLPLNQAYQYLFEAPWIVKQHAAMSWQYLNAPQDGSLFLTWAAPRNNDQFPSDGYIWAGPEERMLQEFGGYTIEIAVQHAGFRPHVDAMACHQRRRYRLVQKNPTVNANPPDRNLWLVHYSAAEPQKSLPASQVAMSRLQQVQFQQRSFIESQGQLEHREFMLHDRERWPQLRFTTGRGIQAVQAMPGPGGPQNAMHLANARFGPQQVQQQQQQAQGGVGPSPAKRQRTGTTAGAPAPAQPVLPEYHDVEAEEEFAFGDYLDTMNQREVSKTRYMVHHEWMEEVFGSQYMTRQIEPASLGFGLMGELSGLTKDIFDTVSDAVKIYTRPEEVTADDVPIGGTVPAERVKDFEKRVNEFLEKGQADLEKMKSDHARRVEEMRKGRALSRSEKRLRNARWVTGDGSEPAVLNGLVSGKGAKEDAEKIVEEVQAQLDKGIVSQPLLHVIDRGGLRERVEPPPEPQNTAIDRDMDAFTHQGDSPGNAQGQPGTTEGQALAANGSAVTNNAQVQPVTTAPSQPANTTTGLDDFDADEHMETLDESNFEIEGMDLDIGDGADFDFGGDTPVVGSGTGTPQQQSLDTSAPAANAGPGAHNANPAAASEPAPVAAPAPAQDAAPAPLAPQTTSEPAPADDTTFNDFTADIDFGGDGDDDVDLGDLGMDNSAFGDAFHGDTPQGDGEGDDQVS